MNLLYVLGLISFILIFAAIYDLKSKHKKNEDTSINKELKSSSKIKNKNELEQNNKDHEHNNHFVR